MIGTPKPRRGLIDNFNDDDNVRLLSPRLHGFHHKASGLISVCYSGETHFLCGLFFVSPRS